jgi:hypothetical protein
LESRVATYKSVLKEVKIRFSHDVEHRNTDYEKLCMIYLETRLGLVRDSEKFNYDDE